MQMLIRGSRSMEPADYAERPPSSVYSQPSPEFHEDFSQSRNPSSVYFDQDPQVPSSMYADISPPDSPEQDIHREWRGSPNISPIEEGSEPEDDFQRNVKPKSNIPVLRNIQNRGGPKPINTGAPTFGWRNKISNLQANEVKWDDYSGEPSENGRKPQVKPGTALQQLAGASKANKLPFRFQKDPPDQERESIAERRSKFKLANSPDSSPVMERESEIDAPNTQPVARKPVERKQIADNEALAALPQREPWKGASGRHAIPTPVANNPAARTQPLTIPTRPTRRPVPDTQSQGEQTPPRSYQPTRGGSQDSRASPTADKHHLEPIKPIVPLKAGRNSPPHIVSSPVSPTYPTKARAASSPVVPSPAAPSPAAPSVRSPSSIYSDLNKPLPTPTEPPKDVPKRRALAGKAPTTVTDAELRSQIQSLNLHEEPSSRFSATTYATTHYDSPPGTPQMTTDAQAPPMPAIPPASYRPALSATPPTTFDSPASRTDTPPLSTAPSPILNRKRPVATQIDRSSVNPYTFNTSTSTKSTVRKPTPSQISRSSVYSNDGGYGPSKALPVSPPELEAPDKVTALQARLDNLQRRRMNLQAILKELTQVIQPSSVAYDMASRAEVKKTVVALEKEMADISKEEHETGLKLHRAWKKRDEENSWGGGGGLWVRRVTG
jgi:hypothetical protein